MAHKDVTALLNAVRRAGGEVSMTQGGHWKISNPATGRSIHLPATPSDRRSHHNAMTRLRRIGIDIGRRKSTVKETA